MPCKLQHFQAVVLVWDNGRGEGRPWLVSFTVYLGNEMRFSSEDRGQSGFSSVGGNTCSSYQGSKEERCPNGSQVVCRLRLDPDVLVACDTVDTWLLAASTFPYGAVLTSNPSAVWLLLA